VYSFVDPKENPPEEMDIVQFSINDEDVFRMGLEFTKQQHNAGTFTDLHKFSLKCLICQKGLKVCLFLFFITNNERNFVYSFKKHRDKRKLFNMQRQLLIQTFLSFHNHFLR
jgi:hypothetical protein